MTETSTTATTDWNLADMADEDFEAFAAWAARSAKAFAAATTKSMRWEPQARRYNTRDRLGRFVKVVDEAAVAEWVNDSNGVSHAHDNCGDLKGTTHTTGTEATGWKCCSCVRVLPTVRTFAHDTAAVTGTKVCACCGTTRKVRSFPTVVDNGWRGRGATCRKCESVRRTAAA